MPDDRERLAVNNAEVVLQAAEDVYRPFSTLSPRYPTIRVAQSPGIVRRGNYLYQDYCSSGRLHDLTILREECRSAAKELGGIGVVRQRLDGLVSVYTAKTSRGTNSCGTFHVWRGLISYSIAVCRFCGVHW